MNQIFSRILTLLIMIGIFIALKHFYYFWIGHYIIYPINLITTFLHEFGHGFFALITGGDVSSIKIGSDGSGLATTSGGIRDLVVAGGYIGSAIFGNILLYIGFKKENLSEYVLYLLSFLMIFTSINWFSNLTTTFLLIAIGITLGLMARFFKFDNIILQFLGVVSIAYIIEDFNVWPTSDLAHFSSFLPSVVWMYIWLAIVVVITGINLKLILKSDPSVIR